MSFYSSVVRPLLFRVPSGRAHDLAHLALRWPTPWGLIGDRTEDSRLATTLAGLTLENPVGLAPGFDKNGSSVRGLDHLGFGYMVIGSVTRYPRAGNPRPRMVRYPKRGALGNNLGLPSLGLDAVVEILRALPPTRARVLVSVTGFTADELVEAAAAVEPVADAVELGLVCPNTTESQRMAELATFEEVAERVMARRSKPVFLRLPPHHDEIEWKRARSLLDVAMATGMDGVGTNGRVRISDPRLPNGEGSISGKPTFPDALRIVREVSDYTEGRLAIRASGGVSTGQDAESMLAAGATTVEFYSALVYRGPRASALINRELLDVIESRGVPHVAALRKEAATRDDPSEIHRD